MNINILILNSKKYLVVIFILTLAINSIAGQSFLLDSEHRSSKILDLLPISINEYVVAYQSTYAEGTTVVWYKDDSIFKKHTLEEQVVDLSLKLTEEGIIVDAAAFYDCDVSSPTFRRFILDTIQGSSSNADPAENSVEPFVSISRLSNDNILLLKGIADDDAYATGIKLTNDNKTLIDLDITIPYISKISEIDGRAYFYGSKYVLYTDIDGGDIDTLFFEDNQVLNIVKTDIPDQIAILTWYGVYIKTIGSEEETFYPISNENGRVKDIIYTDRLYLLRLSFEDQLNTIEVINEDGNWEHLRNLLPYFYYEMEDLYDMEEQGIWASGQFVVASATGFHYYGSAIIQKLDEFEEEANDLGIELISAEGNGEQSIDLTFKVSNNSNKNLKNIKVYSKDIFIGKWCSTPNLDYNLEELSANSSTIIETTVGLYYDDYFTSVCVYILGNGENPDLDMEDNFSCTQVTNTLNLSPIKKQGVYPNPAGSRIALKDTEENDRIEIVDTNGQVVLRTKYRHGIQVSSLPSGIYYLIRNKSQVFKFIKM